jgi:hypothetical protein
MCEDIKMRKARLFIAGLAGLLGLFLFCFAQELPPRYFTVEDHGGAWWFVDPQGKEFFSIGLNFIIPADKDGIEGPKYNGLVKHGGSVERWRAEALARLSAWNINTIGAWSTVRGRPYVIELSLSGNFIDLFDDSFEEHVLDAALAVLRREDVGAGYDALDKDPLLIGYFTDNELAWGWDYGWAGKKDKYSLFEYYASRDGSSAGKRAWASYMAQTYAQDWKRLSKVWNVKVRKFEDLLAVKKIVPRSSKHFAEAKRVGDEFLRRLAERYFSLTSSLMRGYLPHHLNLGIRFTEEFPDVVAEVAAKYVDVLSLNLYARDLDYFRRETTRLATVGKKPVLITEFSFPAKANRSGNSNHGYEQAQVKDDKARGVYYARCTEMLSKMPFVVGYHWFQYFDQATNGRGDGESCNFGFVDLENRVYEDLAAPAAEANARAAAWHRASGTKSEGRGAKSEERGAKGEERGARSEEHDNPSPFALRPSPFALRLWH